MAVDAKLVMRFREVTGLSPVLAQEFLEQLTEFDPETYVLMAQQAAPGMIHDPIEADPIAGPVIDRVLREVEAEVAAQWPSGKSKRGQCHRTWSLARQRLLEQHAIDWKSPAQMTPWRRID